MSPINVEMLFADGMNLYGYFSGNPVSRRDPAALFLDDGLVELRDRAVGVGSIV
jgi:hypothetical protein